MTTLEWTLLPALAALVEESSVSRAAARVGVTVPTMSRMLGRLREQHGDPLLVRAGQRLVPTPYATALRPRVAALVGEAESLLAGGGGALATSTRTLVVRANDALIGPWLRQLLAAVHARAPGVRLAFVAEGEESPADLREGRVDLDVGELSQSAPELRTQVLFRDRFVGVVRRDHPLARGKRTPERIARFEHLGISRKGRFDGPIDVQLAARGLARKVVAAVPSGSAAAMVVAASDLVTGLPARVARALAATLPLATFELPFDLPDLVVSQTWHPRFDADPAHALLRSCFSTLVEGGRTRSARSPLRS